MCKKIQQSRYNFPCRQNARGILQRRLQSAAHVRGFFSFDAAFAITLAVILFASFSLILSSIAKSKSENAEAYSSNLLSLRFSSFILSEAEEKDDSVGKASYAKSYELDLGRLRAIDLASILSKTGKSYGSISIKSERGKIYSAESGIKGGEIYCAKRLALLSGEPVSLEACLS